LAAPQHLEIEDCSGAAEGEFVLPDAAMASVRSRASRHASESMFNPSPTAQLLSALRGAKVSTQLFLEALVVGEAQRSTLPITRGCAVGPQRTDPAQLGRKPDLGAFLERLLNTGRASDGVRTKVELEVELREEARPAGRPGSTDDIAACRQDRINDRAAEVATVDVQLTDAEACRLDEILHWSGGRLFLHIRRRDCDGVNEVGIEVGGNVTLEAVEELVLVLPPVSHLLVGD